MAIVRATKFQAGLHVKEEDLLPPDSRALVSGWMSEEKCCSCQVEPEARCWRCGAIPPLEAILDARRGLPEFIQLRASFGRYYVYQRTSPD
jgi:hypothetical protein